MPVEIVRCPDCKTEYEILTSSFTDEVLNVEDCKCKKEKARYNLEQAVKDVDKYLERTCKL